MNMTTWQHILLWLVVGYLIGYYFRTIGNMTVGKLYASK